MMKNQYFSIVSVLKNRYKIIGMQKNKKAIEINGVRRNEDEKICETTSKI